MSIIRDYLESARGLSEKKDIEAAMLARKYAKKAGKAKTPADREAAEKKSAEHKSRIGEEVEALDELSGTLDEKLGIGFHARQSVAKVRDKMDNVKRTIKGGKDLKHVSSLMKKNKLKD
jgi:hypothetical protein